MKERFTRSAWAFGSGAVVTLVVNLMGPTGAYRAWLWVPVAMAFYGVLAALIAACTRAPRPEWALRVGLAAAVLVATGEILSRVGVLTPQNELDTASEWVSLVLVPVSGAFLGAWFMQRVRPRAAEAS